MKCIKCKTNNINKANYCKNCNYKFSEKEQKITELIGYLTLTIKLLSFCPETLTVTVTSPVLRAFILPKESTINTLGLLDTKVISFSLAFFG